MGEPDAFWAQARLYARTNLAQVIFVIIALLLTGLAMSRLYGEVEKSYQTETDGLPASVATGASASTTPTPTSASPTTAATSSISTSGVSVPAATTSVPALPSPTPGATQTTTSTRGTGSDTLVLGLLALAAFFGFIAVYYNRVSSLTGPGGW